MHVAEKKRLTEDGLKKIEQELENLKTVRRKEIAEKIKVALSFGDLSENSEYDEAKNEQAIIEAKITQLEAMLKVVEVVDTDEFFHLIVMQVIRRDYSVSAKRFNIMSRNQPSGRNLPTHQFFNFFAHARQRQQRSE